MRYKHWCWLLLLSLATYKVQATTTEALVKQVLEQNLHASQQKNSDAYMATVHTQSLSWDITRQQIKGIFDNFDLSYHLDAFELVAQDDEYVYTKVWLTTKKIKGAAFKNNRLQALIVFKQERGEWKIWSQANMQITYLN